MGEPSIPVALGPQGNIVPIEEAERFKTDYYRCKECGEILNPRKGAVRTHYYAHKGGVLEDKSCSLSSQTDVDELVDELRTSDVEKDESRRRIRRYIGEIPGGGIRLFGVLPSLDWDTVPRGTAIDTLLDEMTIRTDGLDNPPVPGNFHPSEPEALFDLNPDATEFTVDIEANGQLESLEGEWNAEQVADGDLFAGDQSRARYRREDQQIKQGEWVYLVVSETPESLPDVVNSRPLGPFEVLGFPAQNETQNLLEAYGEGLTTDQYGFDADVILPPSVHPTSEAPIEGREGQTALISVTPSPEIDPIFEVVSIPREPGDRVEIDPTGPGNPRYFETEFPYGGSRRISIHQRNSNRHRMIHLHSVDESANHAGKSIESDDLIELRIELDEGEEVLTPFGEDPHIKISNQADIATLPGRVSYAGPEGLEIEFTAKFRSGSPHGTIVRRSSTEIEQVIPEISQWGQQGCREVVFHFDGLGDVY